MTATQTDKVTDALSKLEQGLKDLISSGDWKEFLKVQSRFHNYSFNNTILILLQRKNATRVAGYKKWQELGRVVKKGEKGIQILAPILVKKNKKDEQDKEVDYKALCGFRSAYVYDISQTIGDELPESVSPLNGSDEGLLDALYAFSINNKVPVIYEGLVSGANGQCTFDLSTGRVKEITVDPLLPLLHRAKTLAHEIAHSLLHNRDEYLQHTSKSAAELEAESTAFVILDHYGLDTSAYSFGYILGWIGEDKAVESLKESGARIQRAAQRVIEFVDKITAT